MDIYLHNKYTKWYFSIISKAQSRKNLEGYIENHHIIPKCMGGSNRKNNLVALTAREHYICHLLLTKMVEGETAKKMRYGYLAMTIWKNDGHKRDFKMNSRLFESIRKNIRLTEETKRKISLTGKGRPCKYKGIKRPEEVNKKNSNSVKKCWENIDYRTRVVYGIKESIKKHLNRPLVQEILAKKKELGARYYENKDNALTSNWWRKSDEEIEQIHREFFEKYERYTNKT
jgi:hypothetical protein